MADDLSPQDRDLLARTVLSEAGTDGPQGMAAVASVIKNRVASGNYGASPSDVVLQPGQFSAWGLPRTDPNNPSRWSTKNTDYQKAAGIVDSVWSGATPDPTGGADHYLNPAIVKARTGTLPQWAQGQPTAQIGGHAFYAPNGPVTPDLLGSWNKTSAPAAAAPAAATPQEDLLGSWGVAPANPLPGRSPIQNTIHPQGYVAPPSDETPAQWTNRVLAEHQGDTVGDYVTRLGLGTLRGVGDVGDTLAEGIASAGARGANLLNNVGAISPQTAQTVQDWSGGVDQRVVAARTAFDALAANSPLTQAGRIGGQIIGTAPLVGAGGAALEATGVRAALASRPILSTLVSGAGAGAGATALTSAASDEPLLNQTATGALTGGALGPAGYGLSRLGGGLRRLAFGSLDPETAMLAQTARNSGIPVTAGQMTSTPFARFADSVLQRLPLTGYGARTAEQQTGLNRAVAAEMGADADKITPDVLRSAKTNAYVDYDAAKQNLGNLNVDKPFYSDLQNVYDNAHYNLEMPQAKLIDKHLGNVLEKIDPATRTINPDLYQALTRKGGPLDKAINQGDPKLATYASDIKEALENLVGRNDPALKDLKDKADYKYFVAKSLETGRENLISPTGDVNPALLYGAVDRSATPVGTLGQIGKRFMKEPPSSGTAERLLTMAGIGTGLGAIGLGGYEFDPEHFQRNAALTASALALGRGGSALLRSNAVAKSLIRSGLPQAGPSGIALSGLLARAAPLTALTYRGANRLPGQ